MSAPTRFLDLADPRFDVTGPAVIDAREEGFWARTSYGYAVLRHAEVTALLKDRRFRQGNARWPAQNGIHSGMFSDWWQRVLLSLEGEEHLRVRRLLNPAFKQGALTPMVPGFTALAHELVDGFCERGSVEFISEFAEPYASRILCRLVGLPESEWLQVAHWADDLGKSFGVRVKEDLPRIEAALDGLYGYCDEVVRDRTTHPRDDMVSDLVRHQQEGKLSAEELSVALVFLVFAGMETTRNQLGLALQTLLAHPDQWRLLGEQPELGRNAVEEVMRVNPTVTWITREALQDVDLGDGLVLREGDIVQVLSHSAGTDPRAQPDPAFDIRVEHPMHMGFGGGVHHCLGHWVARMDMSVALPVLAARMPDARPDGPGEWLPVSGNTGAIRYPIAFTPTARRG
ncbi:cytochrome P450 [Ornithinimicrobium tianjinense]|uniref:Cytochrome P450 n=1 Tax=Ornithinimicrobium tianjinense TaxID=1195761 RepID=A0A917BS62_9MICO|nr:cytochrome P450 [Ornithinimicrobium tianjinense]GGF55467.1 cytochrome P450 [Ornithinimicrobium tianjinense]